MLSSHLAHSTRALNPLNIGRARAVAARFFRRSRACMADQQPASGAAPGAAAGGTAVPAETAAAATSQEPPQPQQQQQPQQQRVRDYPEEPRVGVGVVILRALPPAGEPEVLLIRRSKEPSKGLWCFPGGSLELGETLVECAVRETQEETGVLLRNAPREGELFSDGLDFPSPVSSSDAMVKDAGGRLLYHYAIINLAAVPEDPLQPLVPGDDADGAQWFPVSRLRGLKDLVVHCDRVAERAVRQYTLLPPPGSE